jgi:hypothetical protein
MTLGVYARVMMEGIEERGRLQDLAGLGERDLASVPSPKENPANSPKTVFSR